MIRPTTQPTRSRGRPPHPDVLTPAEWDVLERVRHGMTNREIARARQTSLDAAKFHVANIIGKPEVDNRADLRHWRGSAMESVFNEAHACHGGGTAMSDELQLGALGQVSMPVTDVAAADRFYHGVLGLPHIFTFGDLAFFDCDGTRLFCTAMEEGDRPAGSSVLYFEILDMDGAYDEMQSKGVQCQAAPHMIFRHDDGVEEWMAFFKDPFDNVLALMARVEAR